MSSRKEVASPSQLEVITLLSSPSSCKALHVLYDLLSSCSGPAGKIHMITNNCGGHITMTSSSQRLLSAISFSRPELKLIVSAVQNHLKQHRDCGLLMTCVCLSLVRLSIQTGYNSYLFQQLNETFLEIILDYLNSSRCEVAIKADYSNLCVLLAYVRSLINSKSLLNSRKEDSDALAEIIVRCFVESIPSPMVKTSIRHSDGVFITGRDKEDIRNSSMTEGLLVEYPELSAMDGPVNLNLVTVPSNESGDAIKVALVICSMSGDAAEIVDAVFEVTAQQDRNVEETVIDRIQLLCDRLVDYGTGMVLCQKVIHPRLKARLKARNVVVMDRLGSVVIPYLQDLTGAIPILSVVSTYLSDIEKWLGRISSVTHEVENNKSYLHLSRPSSAVVTLILCSEFEEKLAEFKVNAKSALQGLFSLAKEPRLLAGGGCWQSHCSSVLFQQVSERWSSISSKTGYSKAQIFSALSVFRSALHHWIISLSDKQAEDMLVSPNSGHVWKVPKGRQLVESVQTDISSQPDHTCCCGLLSASGGAVLAFDYISCSGNLSIPRHISTLESTHIACAVLDSFSAATQAISNAVLAANLVVSIGQFITDRN